MEIFFIITLIALFFGTVGWVSTHNVIKPLFWTTLGGIGLLSGYWGVQMAEAPGWDALTYFFLLILGSAPAGIALLLGAGIGLLTCKKHGGAGLGAIPS